MHVYENIDGFRDSILYIYFDIELRDKYFVKQTGLEHSYLNYKYCLFINIQFNLKPISNDHSKIVLLLWNIFDN